jgi:hypothetical protein
MDIPQGDQDAKTGRTILRREGIEGMRGEGRGEVMVKRSEDEDGVD